MRVLLILMSLLWAAPSLATIGPGEVMQDPALQHRAMALYEELRCVKCRSENIASSNADWANDARALVRERLLAGDSDAAVRAFFQARYGDYVLMAPPISSSNLGLWLAGPVLLLAGAGLAFAFVRGRGKAAPVQETGLSEDEARRLAELTRGEG